MPLLGPPDIRKLKAKGNVNGLVKALRYAKDPAVPLAALQALVETEHASEAVEALKKSGDAQAVELLIVALGIAHVDARRLAAAALGYIGEPQAREPLRAALADGEPDVRKAAAQALRTLRWSPDRSEASAAYWVVMGRWDKCVEIGEPAVGPLATALTGASSLVRSSAAEALGRIGSRQAVGPLIAAFKSEPVPRRPARRSGTKARLDVHTAAATALAQIGAPAAEPLTAALEQLDDGQRRSARDVLVKIGSSAVGPLIVALQESDAKVLAAEALGRIGDTRAAEPLIAAVADGHSPVRLAATKALGRIGDERAVPPLVALLGARRGDERRAAIDALGQIGDARAAEPLVAVLVESSSQQLRQAAAKALAKLGWQPERDQTGALYWVTRREWQRCAEIGAPAVEPLASALRQKSKDTSTGAADALAQIGAPAVEALLLALEDDQIGVRTRAAEALGRIGDRRAVEPLIAVLEGTGGLISQSKAAIEALLPLRLAVVRALGQIGDPQAFVPLITALADGIAGVRGAALEALRQAGDPKTTLLADALVALRDGPGYAEAARTLGEMADRRAVQPLVALLDSYWTSTHRYAAGALGQIGDLRAIEPLGVALKDREWRVRSSAAEALGNLPDARAVELLIGALDHAEHRTRRAAGRALVQLYREGTLDERAQRMILAQRQRISAPHTDEHHENAKGCFSVHVDSGIGVTFPL